MITHPNKTSLSLDVSCLKRPFSITSLHSSVDKLLKKTDMSFASKLSPDTAKIGGIGRLEIQVAKEDVTVQWFKSKFRC